MWHKATDHLKGIDIYGDPNNGIGAESPEWSIRFDHEKFDEFLFATGDGSKWIIIPADEFYNPKQGTCLMLNGRVDDLEKIRASRSSLNGSEHYIKVMNRPTVNSEPSIALLESESDKV